VTALVPDLSFTHFHSFPPGRMADAIVDNVVFETLEGGFAHHQCFTSVVETAERANTQDFEEQLPVGLSKDRTGSHRAASLISISLPSDSSRPTHFQLCYRSEDPRARYRSGLVARNKPPPPRPRQYRESGSLLSPSSPLPTPP
jgi:hypothetical protein